MKHREAAIEGLSSFGTGMILILLIAWIGPGERRAEPFQYYIVFGMQACASYLLAVQKSYYLYVKSLKEIKK